MFSVKWGLVLCSITLLLLIATRLFFVPDNKIVGWIGAFFIVVVILWKRFRKQRSQLASEN